MIDRVRAELQVSLPAELVNELLDQYVELKSEHQLGRHTAAELAAGKFVEASVRVLEFVTDGGSFTPLGEPIKNMSGKLLRLANADKSHGDEVRLLIPRALDAIYTIRNKRGVGHVAGTVSPNVADSTYLCAGADWVLAELIRLNHRCPVDEAQAIVNDLVRYRLPLVYEGGEVKRVLHPGLPQRDAALLLLAASRPDGATDRDLATWIEAKNITDFRKRVLLQLHKERLIEHAGTGACTISPTGIAYVDREHGAWLRELMGDDGNGR